MKLLSLLLSLTIAGSACAFQPTSNKAPSIKKPKKSRLAKAKKAAKKSGKAKKKKGRGKNITSRKQDG